MLCLIICGWVGGVFCGVILVVLDFDRILYVDVNVIVSINIIIFILFFLLWNCYFKVYIGIVYINYFNIVVY